MIVASCFQRFYLGIRGSMIHNIRLSTTCGGYVLLFTTKKKTNFGFVRKRGFNMYPGVFGCADFVYINANITRQLCLCFSLSS